MHTVSVHHEIAYYTFILSSIFEKIERAVLGRMREINFQKLNHNKLVFFTQNQIKEKVLFF